jgi:hypothetical protein
MVRHKGTIIKRYTKYVLQNKSFVEKFMVAEKFLSIDIILSLLVQNAHQSM